MLKMFINTVFKICRNVVSDNYIVSSANKTILELSFVICGKCGPGSVVGIATAYELEGPGIESRCGRDFLHLSRPALKPTGSFPRVRCGRGVTLTPHPLLGPRSKIE